MTDREQAIRAIAEGARQTRRRPSRGLWIVAAIVGVLAVIGFVVVMVSDGSVPSPATARPTTDRGYGFIPGLIAGGVLGIAIGFAIARHRHSSRNKP